MLSFLPEKLRPQYQYQIEVHQKAIKRLKEADKMLYGYYPRLYKEARYAQRYHLKVKIKERIKKCLGLI